MSTSPNCVRSARLGSSDMAAGALVVFALRLTEQRSGVRGRRASLSPAKAWPAAHPQQALVGARWMPTHRVAPPAAAARADAGRFTRSDDVGRSPGQDVIP